MSTSEDSPSSGVQIFNNEVILSEICKYLAQGSLVKVSVINKRSWKIAIARIWNSPYLTHIEQLRAFNKIVDRPLPIAIKDRPHYGSMVRKFDLSMLGGRWEKLGSKDLEPVFKHCTDIFDLNINLCQNIQDAQLIALFENNPEICRSIKSLDMCETMYSDKAISKVIRLIPKLDELKLNETYASTHTVNAVAETQGFLSSIELFDCDVSADQILKLYEKCILLTEIGAPRSLAQDLDDFALEFDMERCGELYFDDDDYDSEDLYLENDEDVNYEFYYENDEDNSDDLFDDNFDNIMHSMMYW